MSVISFLIEQLLLVKASMGIFKEIPDLSYSSNSVVGEPMIVFESIMSDTSELLCLAASTKTKMKMMTNKGIFNLENIWQ